jgi:hypothetical protein
MSDPKNENAGATPPEATPAAEASEEQTQATPAGEAAQEQAAAAVADQPTAVMPPAYAAAPAAAGPGTPWYRRRRAVITGSVAAGVILFLGGMAVGSTLDGNDRGEVGRDFHDQMRQDGGQGSGQQGWGDSGGGRGMVPPMQGGEGYGQGAQGYGPHDWDQDGGMGRHWDQDGGQGYGRPLQAPSAAPSAAPSTTPQAYYQ